MDVPLHWFSCSFVKRPCCISTSSYFLSLLKTAVDRHVNHMTINSYQIISITLQERPPFKPSPAGPPQLPFEGFPPSVPSSLCPTRARFHPILPNNAFLFLASGRTSSPLLCLPGRRPFPPDSGNTNRHEEARLHELPQRGRRHRYLCPCLLQKSFGHNRHGH